MDLLRYYILVVRTASSHVLDYAQATIFAMLIIVGLASAFPNFKMSIDVSGWQAAAIVLATIIIVRLILAPYWIWKGQLAKIANLEGEVAAQQDVDYAHGLGFVGIEPSLDPGNPTNTLELRLLLRNDVDGVPLRFFVDRLEYSIEGKTVKAHAAYPATIGKGSTPMTFYPNVGFSKKDYKTFQARTAGILQYTIRYGSPSEYRRIASKTFDLQIFKNKERQNKEAVSVKWTVRSETDVPT